MYICAGLRASTSTGRGGDQDQAPKTARASRARRDANPRSQPAKPLFTLVPVSSHFSLWLYV